MKILLILAAALSFAEEPAPTLVGAEAPLPEDIVSARARWGIEAQLARLSRDPKEEFRFALLGDVEPGRFPWQRIFAPEGAFRRQLASIHSLAPDFILQLGDFVSKGTVENYREYVRSLDAGVTLPMLHVIGNHDRSRPNGRADKILYTAVFGRSDFYFDHNGWRFVALDSSNYAVTEAQLDWLDSALDTPLKTVVATHIVPEYLRGRLRSVGPEDAIQQTGAIIPEAYFERGSARFGEIVARRKVERVYMGHIHAFGIAFHQGVRYVVTAGGGSPLYPLPSGYPTRRKAHFIEASAGPNGILEIVRELDGTTFAINWGAESDGNRNAILRTLGSEPAPGTQRL